jgi:hypothetical protein
MIMTCLVSRSRSFFSASLVPSGCLFIDEHSSVGNAIFDKVGHPKTMILAWTVHDLVELVLIALFLLVADVLALALEVLLPWPGGPSPCDGGLSGLAKPKGLTLP